MISLYIKILKKRAICATGVADRRYTHASEWIIRAPVGHNVGRTEITTRAVERRRSVVGHEHDYCIV